MTESDKETPLNSFDLDRRLVLGLEAMEINKATDVQAQVVPEALKGGDLKVRAETGSGKTLAYLLPIAQKLLTQQPPRNAGTLALVLVPTRELARQVLKHARTLLAKTGLEAHAITGGADFKYQKAVFRKNPEIIIGTPGRILEHCERRSVDFNSLQTLVLDEADRMLDMGFREDVVKIGEACNPEKQVLMLSATLKHKGMSDIANALLRDPRTISIGEVREPHSQIFHQRILADSQEHKDKLLTALLQSGGFKRALVFANKRITASRLAGLLSHTSLRAAELQGEMSTEERKHVMSQFSDGKVDILCASDLAARGLDVKDVDLVVNYDLPFSGDDYLHRTGRTGRAGAKGLAVSLVSANDWNLMVSIQRYLKLKFEPRAIAGLKAKYSGPKNVKSSGKAAGSKKKRSKTAPDKGKTRARNQKSQGKPKRGDKKTEGGSNDGFAPLMKKKTRD
jgi:ATP-dependent RNA helicase SrmB